VAYIPVLAEHTTQVAVAEEDGAGAPDPHESPLLPEMGMKGCYPESSAGPAFPDLPFKPVDSAFPGTEITGTHPFPQEFCTLLKFPAAMQ